MLLHGEPVVALRVGSVNRLCLAQISSTLLRSFSYNEIHNRRVALGIMCVQCSPAQLEQLRRAGAMPLSSRRCGLITQREAERLVRSFLEEHAPPALPPGFAFDVRHTCGWGCRGKFLPDRYTSSRAKCVSCSTCGVLFSPNKFIFHNHALDGGEYRQPDAANFNAWRRHLELDGHQPSDALVHAWEDVKAMFNGGSRKRGGGSTCNISDDVSRSKTARNSADSRSESMEVASTLRTPSSLLPHASPLYMRPSPYLPYNMWSVAPFGPSMLWSKSLAWNPLVSHMFGLSGSSEWSRPASTSSMLLPSVEDNK